MSVIGGRRSGGNTEIEASRVTASQKSGKYTSLDATLADGAADYPITNLTGGSDFFSPLDDSVCNFLEIYSSQTIYLKFRTQQNAAVAVADLKSIKVRANTTKTIDIIADVTEIYLTNNSGSNANISVVAI